MRAVARKRAIQRSVQSNLVVVTQSIQQVFDDQFNDLLFELAGDGELEKMGWPDWFDRFVSTTKTSLAKIARDVGLIEAEYWNEKGRDLPEVDPWYAIAQYENRSGHKIADIAKSTRDRTLEAVSDWYNDPEQTKAELASKLKSIYGPERAASIAYYESSALSSQVARESMLQLGLTKWNWDVGSGACESICLPKAAHNPYDIDAEMPPGHPYCDCGVVYVEDERINKLFKAFDENEHKRGKDGKFEYAGGRKRDKERAERKKQKEDPEKLKQELRAKREAKWRAIDEEERAKKPVTPQDNFKPANFEDLGGFGQDKANQRLAVCLSESTKFRDLLSDDEVQNITDYTSQHVYTEINGYLRTGKGDPELQKRVAIIDAALEKAPPLDKSRVLYRGLSKIPEGIAPGTYFTEKGYSSATLSKEVATVFAHGGDDVGEAEERTGALVHIAAPKGSKAAFVEIMSEMGGEDELLLPRETKYHVDRVEKDAMGITHVYTHIAGAK